MTTLATPTTVVIIPCGGRKADTDTPVPAGELYTGSYHRAARRAADTLAGTTGRVLILSALHGLVTLDTMLAPYELRAGQPGTVTADTLRAQAAALCITNAAVTVLGGRAYVELARQVWPTLTAPLAGTRGIGEQLARLAAIYKPAPAPAPVFDAEAARQRIEARHAEQAAREARRRAAYVTADTIRVDRHGRATVAFTFPSGTGKAKVEARIRAARRFAAANGVTTTQPDALTLAAHGTPERVARFASALPRLIELVENYTMITVKHYGRWENHSTNQHHMDGLDATERRARLRRFRAEAFDAIVDTLLRPANEPAPRIDENVTIWEQAAAVAANYAEYGWFDVTAKADRDEAAALLAAAIVETSPALATVTPIGPRVLARPARRPAARGVAAARPAFDQLTLFAA
ncbi:DUF6884 domain-containing protein [Nonomuraea sp. NPDC005650]|uniref:DUF6884 domain-containing protein n=1 Tax=Nonomuraea sp. NPDC005650 TaxID=3157045 RepID=UPI0033AF3CB2